MAHVLIVDDSLMMRKFLSMALASEGYQLSEAAGGEEAIDIVNASPPDCMILDLLMPGMVGTEVLEVLKKEQHVPFPIIVVTADVQESTHETCKALGAYTVLTKPPKGDVLCATIKEAMAAAQGDF